MNTMTNSTQCIWGTHTLVCECGEPLERYAHMEGADEWSYKSARTGAGSIHTLPPLLVARGWDWLGDNDHNNYLRFRHMQQVGTLVAHHYHLPVDCVDEEGHEDVAWCCGKPMHFSPAGWVCRNEDCREW